MDTHKLAQLFKSLLDIFVQKSKTMADEDRAKGGPGNEWGYYSYYTGIIMGAQVHLERRQSYEKYLKDESSNLFPHETTTIALAMVKVVTESNLLYTHLEKNLKTDTISIDTEKVSSFIDAVDHLNDIYYTITDVDY